MNHQAKVVSNDSIVVYFSLYEVSQSTGVPVKELMRAIGNIVGPLSGLAYVSVINRTDAKKWDREENFFPLLNEAKFTINTSLLKLDISGTIISCKITLLNPNTPHDHLMSYQTGLVKGEYSFVPRLVSNGKYLYPKPQDQIDPEAESEVIPNGSVSIIGFDLLFNDNCDEKEYVPADIKERIDEMFPGAHKDISEDHFRRYAPQYSIQPLYPAERPDPNFTPTTVNPIVEVEEKNIDLENLESLHDLLMIFHSFNEKGLIEKHFSYTKLVDSSRSIKKDVNDKKIVDLRDFLNLYLEDLNNQKQKENIINHVLEQWGK